MSQTRSEKKRGDDSAGKFGTGVGMLALRRKGVRGMPRAEGRDAAAEICRVRREDAT